MKLKDTLYDSLTPRQRIIASFEAKARGDDQEVEKLIKTCPKKTYQMTDPDYSDEMTRLTITTLMYECQIRKYMVMALANIHHGNSDKVDKIAHEIGTLHNLWSDYLSDYGVDIDMILRGAMREGSMI